METKFKAGDTVRCIDEGSHGSGWKSGKVFVVDRIKELGGNNNVYWEEGNYAGVYEDSLELVDDNHKVTPLKPYDYKTI